MGIEAERPQELGFELRPDAVGHVFAEAIDRKSDAVLNWRRAEKLIESGGDEVDINEAMMLYFMSGAQAKAASDVLDVLAPRTDGTDWQTAISERAYERLSAGYAEMADDPTSGLTV